MCYLHTPETLDDNDIDQPAVYHQAQQHVDEPPDQSAPDQSAPDQPTDQPIHKVLHVHLPPTPEKGKWLIEVSVRQRYPYSKSSPL